ncbi:hypothetical protein [Streptomyces sp. NPDC006631]|uniref:hypothetical protein n=1 Tax=Streptomyces sp. NPDC006631 TaxID=3364752 RepID=UPI00367CFB23
MPMNRGDYETLSAAIADTDDEDRDARRAVAFNIADALTGTSTRFDPVRWLRDCNLGDIVPSEVADWSTRLGLRVKAISDKQRAYEQRTGEKIERY